MHREIIEHEISGRGVKRFRLDLEYPRVAIVGHSGTGKTFTCLMIEDIKSSGIIEDLGIFARCDVVNVCRDSIDGIEDTILNAKDRIIFIDEIEGNLGFGREKLETHYAKVNRVKELIRNDFQNKYVIMSRDIDGFDAVQAELIITDCTLQIKYD